MLNSQDQNEDGSNHVDILAGQEDTPEAVGTGVVGGDVTDVTTVLAISKSCGQAEEEILLVEDAEVKVEVVEVKVEVVEVKVEEKVGTQLSKTQSLAMELAAVNQTLYPSSQELPPRPLSANECNFTHYFSVDVAGKFLQDQYVYRHANGLCVVGLAPTHPALLPTTQVLEVDFNVGKLSRAEMKVSGKHKKNGRALEANSALCKVVAGDDFYLPRCCVRGVLLEVNDRLIKNPSLLKTRAATEGHIAVLMPRPEDWAKAEKILYTREQYQLQRGIT